MSAIDQTEAIEVLAGEVERLQTALDMTNSELDVAMDRITDLEDELELERCDSENLCDRAYELEQLVEELEETILEITMPL